jgi:hypothetical protein
MLRKRTIIGIGALLGVAIAVPATAAFAGRDDRPAHAPAPGRVPVAPFSPAIEVDPADTSSHVAGPALPGPSASIIVIHQTDDSAPPPLPIPPGRPHGFMPPPLVATDTMDTVDR